MNRLKNVASKQAADANIKKKGSRLNGVIDQNGPDSKLWIFSFRFYQQHEHFGFDGDKIEKVWFVSLLERLAALGKMTLDEVLANPASAQNIRCHPIDWAKKNVPIARNTLNWIDKIYLNDEENYPMRQFSVSTSHGRVVGFFDENQTFQIVLLDPLHNIQPSKDFDYAVDPCHPLGCELSQLKSSIEKALHSAPACGCGVVGKVRSSLEKKTREYMPPIILTPIDEETMSDAKYIMNNSDNYYSDIVKAGVYALLGSVKEES